MTIRDPIRDPRSTFWPRLTRRLLRYAAAPLAVAAAVYVRHALEEWLGTGLPPYITFYLGVMGVALLAGFGPGMLVTAIAAAHVGYSILPPSGQFAIASPIDRASLAIFIAAGLFLSVIAELFRRHREKATAYDREAAVRSSEEALRESEERLRIALEAADLGTWDLDLATGITVRSLRHDQIFGYRERQPQWTFETTRQHVLPEDLPIITAAHAQALATGSMALEARVLWPDGSLHWIHLRGRVFNDARGHPARLIGVVAEITARLEAEQKLRRSEALYRGIGESIDYGVWVCEPDGRNVYASESFLRMLGITQAQCSDFGWGDVLHPDDAAATLAAWQACVRSGTHWNREHRFRGADGNWHHVLARGVPIRDGEDHIIWWAGINLDITSLKQAQEEVRSNEQRLRLATEATGVGVWEWQLSTGRIRWDAQMFRLYGIPPTDDGFVSYSDWSAKVLAEDLPRQEEILQDVVHGRATGRRDFRIRHQGDGEIRYIEAVETVRANAQGEAEWVVGTNLDITSRKNREAALRAAMAAAERANNAKSRFLAAASHDLRQPLSALNIYAGLLKNTVAPKNRKLVANMQDCLVSLSALLNDLLDLSKLEAGVVTPCVSDFPIAVILTYLESIHVLEAQLKGLRLRCLSSPVIARSDPLLFKRLLNNLVANAIRYTQKGGVLIACRRRQGKTWVEVWDTGIGIPADKTSEIFEEFKQLGDGARSQGSGLGLAIVARTAALLGLEIRVRSRPGRGSVFAVELPLGESGSVSPVTTPPAVSATPLRIALVEDNRMVREALVVSLQRLGHEVVATATLAEILTALDARPPDIVVADYRLTGGDTGYHIITALRTRFGLELPAILITGDTEPMLLRSMSDLGIVVLHKPLDLAALQISLEDLTGKVTSEREDGVDQRSLRHSARHSV
ncbi:MAG: PAS domain-containing protein [Candidatus Accumulibacter sp. UW27]